VALCNGNLARVAAWWYQEWATRLFRHQGVHRSEQQDPQYRLRLLLLQCGWCRRHGMSLHNQHFNLRCRLVLLNVIRAPFPR
jgi:hypothetical protein